MVRLVQPDPEEKEGPEPEPLLYNTEAAAKILGGISPSMIYRYVHRKELRPIKLGNRSLFTMEELRRFVKWQSTHPQVKKEKPPAE